MDAAPHRNPVVRQRILVIRLGALGDFVQSFAPFAAIRAHHATDHVMLLTTEPFAAFARASPWFDAVRIDRRPAAWNLPGLLRLARTLRAADTVYDLQTSRRSSLYRRLAPRPSWSGIAPGSSHPHNNTQRDAMHTRERQREQLAMAGISEFPPADLRWLIARKLGIDLPTHFALLVPGAAPHRPAKRWPADRFGGLAALLASQGLTPVVAGGPGDAPFAATIREACPEAIDLTGRTGLLDLGTLAAGAALAVGNDTGPMHLAAAVGCPSLVLFSADSDPALTAPRYPDGGWPAILREADLADLSLDRVAAALPPRH